MVIKKDGIENIFLTYANHSLKHHPENLRKIFEMFNSQNINIDESAQTAISNIINHFITLVKCKDLIAANDVRKNAKLDSEGEKRNFEIAFEGIFGFRDGYCEKRICSWRKEKEVVLDCKMFIGPERLKCYECDQLYFKNILAGIEEGKEYKNIANDGFVNLIANAYTGLEKGVTIITEGRPIKELLEEVLFFNPNATIYWKYESDYPYKENFSKLFFN